MYFKRTEDVKSLLADLQKCPDDAMIQVEEFPSRTYTDSKGNVQALFTMYVDDYQVLISRKLKEWLIEKEVLLP